MSDNTETKDVKQDDALAARMEEATSDTTIAGVKTSDDTEDASTADHTETIVAPDGQVNTGGGNRADGSDTGGVM
jgi:hypothetical protein